PGRRRRAGHHRRGRAGGAGGPAGGDGVARHGGGGHGGRGEDPPARRPRPHPPDGRDLALRPPAAQPERLARPGWTADDRYTPRMIRCMSTTPIPTRFSDEELALIDALVQEGVGESRSAV